VTHRVGEAFAIWITGLPASGKSTIARSLLVQMNRAGFDAAILESDHLRKILGGQPRYDEAGRAAFYQQMAHMGASLTQHGVPVIFDATANRRSYRAWAREHIPHLLEVYVDTPLRVCESRDPKAIYQQARAGLIGDVPGLQVAYEPPECPDVVVHGDREAADAAARRIMATLAEKGYLVESDKQPASSQ